MSGRKAIGLGPEEAATAPFSPVVRCGELLFFSGQVAMGADGARSCRVASPRRPSRC